MLTRLAAGGRRFKSYKRHYDEVVDAFEVPLPFLMDARNHQVHVRELGGRERRFYAMPYGDRFIWGATAGILRNMHERLFRS